MLRTFTRGGVIPWGHRSALPNILLFSRVMAFSMSVPTRKRAVAMLKLGKLDA